MSTPPLQSAPVFERLSPSVFLHAPHSPISASPKVPSTILIFTWLNAPARATAKYALQYTQLYPESRILLVTCTGADLSYRPTSTQLRNLAPALSVLLNNPAEQFLVHVFSNGGAHHILNLAELYRDKTGKALPIRGMILDSIPGSGEFLRSIRGLVTSFRSMLWWRRWIATVVVYVTYSLAGIIWGLMGWKNMIERIRDGLNDERLIHKGARRTYIYGKGDEVVLWDDIESHAKEAKAIGYQVRTEEFEGTAHVAHVRGDHERYWEVVRDCWTGEE
ncbi:hypothetical protein BDD12DRAFT_802916 [Trichophaea hybrida]|nr:hypothetical protein BDD12DRAFT_802916 [Trichophaea hybrida]